MRNWKVGRLWNDSHIVSNIVSISRRHWGDERLDKPTVLPEFKALNCLSFRLPDICNFCSSAIDFAQRRFRGCEVPRSSSFKFQVLCRYNSRSLGSDIENSRLAGGSYYVIYNY